jgi:hypothetical protein
MSSNTQIPHVEEITLVEYPEPKQDINNNNDDTIAQIIMADHQYKEIIAKSRKSEAYKLKYLKAKKHYYYK